MTQERTPLAVVATAMTDQVVRASAVIGTPQSADWWSSKKRKRTVACGQCDACCRNDCGTCLNCLDKPKFGGNGIRKQSCLERKCRQPTAAPTPSGGSSLASVVKLAVPPPPPTNDAARNSMPPQEWEAFWGAVECCMLLQGGTVAGGMAGAGEDRAAKRGRTNRCGACAGCLRGDCGSCKNCKDKPKFGGKGIKKQACVRRACNNPMPDDDDEEGSQHSEQTAASGGFLSAQPSPPVGPSSDSFSAEPPAFVLGGGGGGGAPQSGLSWLTKAANDGTSEESSMLQDTRRRLQQLRAMKPFPDGERVRPDSSMSMGYSTADEYEAGAAEPDDDDEEGHSATEDLEEAAGATAEAGSSSAHASVARPPPSGTPPCKLEPAAPLEDAAAPRAPAQSAEAMLVAMAMAAAPSAAPSRPSCGV